jgi:hypothetical protein
MCPPKMPNVFIDSLCLAIIAPSSRPSAAPRKPHTRTSRNTFDCWNTQQPYSDHPPILLQIGVLSRDPPESIILPKSTGCFVLTNHLWNGGTLLRAAVDVSRRRTCEPGTLRHGEPGSYCRADCCGCHHHSAGNGVTTCRAAPPGSRGPIVECLNPK